jgi:hypothetical protein
MCADTTRFTLSQAHRMVLVPWHEGSTFLLQQWLPSLRLSAFEVRELRHQPDLHAYFGEPCRPVNNEILKRQCRRINQRKCRRINRRLCIRIYRRKRRRTNQPTNAPTDPPTKQSTFLLTNPPTNAPSDTPTNQSTFLPTNAPSDPPTNLPADFPADECNENRKLRLRIIQQKR